ncbi:MAG: STAS domain-containing protein [Actinomycetota bacterium]
MKYEIAMGAGGPVLVLRDQLTYSDRDAFEALIADLLARASKNVTVDLNALDYMDSAGLGMLLTLRDQAQRRAAEVVLRRPKGDVAELLALACFDSLFVIEA